MSKIFISYSRRDSDFAYKLAQVLSDAGADIWIDTENIPVGMKWHKAIQKGLEICDVMILVISPDSMASENVDDEWTYFHSEEKPIVPIVWREADNVPFQLRRLQYVNFFRQSFGTAFAQLTEELQKFNISLDSFEDDITDIPKAPKSKQDLPNSVSLLDVFEVSHVDELNVNERWHTHDDPANADWLTAPIGVGINSGTRYFNTNAEIDGTHYYVLGDTGSGKSEFLLTLINSMAINYSSTRFAFTYMSPIFAYYNDFKNYPQFVKSVSNGTKILRELEALRDEIDRRGHLIARKGSKHIVHYHQRGLHRFVEPYPQLFVVIDHLDYLLEKTPEIFEYINIISRLGRAVGVNLILSSSTIPNHPDFEQLLTNIKTRIVFRTKSVEASNLLLGTEHAIEIPDTIPGRCIIRTGDDLEYTQIAYAGRNTGWQWHDEDDVVASGYIDKAIVDATQQNDTLDYKYQWLPAFVTITDILEKPDEAPYLQQELPITWDAFAWDEDVLSVFAGFYQLDRPYHLDIANNLLIYGDDQTGKTTFIQSILTTLAYRIPPDKLQMQIIAPTDDKLHRVIGRLPHVKQVTTPDARSDVTALFADMQNMIEKRRDVMQSDDTFYKHNKIHGDFTINVLVVDTLSELLNKVDCQQQLAQILREGRNVGVYVIATDTSSDAWEMVYNMFAERIVLTMPKPIDYVFTLGEEVSDPPVKGRGYIRENGEIHKVQFAVPNAEYLHDDMGGDSKLAKSIIQLVMKWR